MDPLNNKGQNSQGYFIISAIIFAIIAIMNIVRLVNHASLPAGSYSIGWEWVGLIITGLMCIWGFSSSAIR